MKIPPRPTTANFNDRDTSAHKKSPDNFAEARELKFSSSHLIGSVVSENLFLFKFAVAVDAVSRTIDFEADAAAVVVDGEFAAVAEVERNRRRSDCVDCDIGEREVDEVDNVIAARVVDGAGAVACRVVEGIHACAAAEQVVATAADAEPVPAGW